MTEHEWQRRRAKYGGTYTDYLKQITAGRDNKIQSITTSTVDYVNNRNKGREKEEKTYKHYNPRATTAKENYAETTAKREAIKKEQKEAQSSIEFYDYSGRIKEIEGLIKKKNTEYRQLTDTVNLYAGERGYSSEYNTALSRQGYLYDEIEALKKLKKAYEKAEKYGGIVNEDDFLGQFGANYRVSDISRDRAKSASALIDKADKKDPYDDYDTSNPDIAKAVEIGRKLRSDSYAAQADIYKEATTTYGGLLEDYTEHNEKALDEEGQVLPWVSKSLAGQLPQTIDQAKVGIPAYIGGAVAGSIIGQPAKGGAIAAGIATGAQEYDVVRGSVYLELVNAGIDHETAVSAANDEALISSIIEGGSNVLGLLLMGSGKALGAIGGAAQKSIAKGSTNAATRFVANAFKGNMVKKAAVEAAKPLWRKAVETGVGILGNAASEGIEEYLQQGVSIANKERAAEGETGKLNLTARAAKKVWDAVSGEDPEARAEMREAGIEGMKIGLLLGGSQTITNNVVASFINAETVERQNEIADAVLDDDEALTALIEEGKASGDGTVAAKVAKEVEVSKEKGTVTRDQVKRLIATNEVYIQAEERQAAEADKYSEKFGENGKKQFETFCEAVGSEMTTEVLVGFDKFYEAGRNGLTLEQARKANSYYLDHFPTLVKGGENALLNGAYYSGQNDAKAATEAEKGEHIPGSSIVLERDENEYPYDQRKVAEKSAKQISSMELSATPKLRIEGYEDAVDDRIMMLAEKVRKGQYKENDSVELGKTGSSEIQAVSKILGIDVSGYDSVIEARQIRHIITRHGINGTADKSMRNDEDIARLKFVIDNYDDAFYGGTSSAYTTIKQNGKPREADTVVFAKKINGTYFVVQAVPQTKKKKLFVVSAFISDKTLDEIKEQYFNKKQKNRTSRDASLRQSSKTSVVTSEAAPSENSNDPGVQNQKNDSSSLVGTNSSADSSISENGKDVKRKNDTADDEDSPDIGDIKKATGFGDEGAQLVAKLMSKGKSLEEAQKTVKPMYIAGFTGGDVKRAKTDIQKRAFDAGTSDKVAQREAARSKAKKATVRDGSLIENEASGKLSKVDREIIKTVAKDLGLSVSVAEKIVVARKDGIEYEADARHRDGELTLTGARPVFRLVLHEAGHRMEQLATEEWNTLCEALYERAEQLGRRMDLGATDNLRFDRVKGLHDKAGITMDTSGYVGEVVMRELETIFSSAEEYSKWLSEISSDRKVKSAWRKFMDFVSGLIGKVRNALKNAGLSKDARAQMKSELAELERIRGLYADAYRATKSAVEQRRKDSVEAWESDVSGETRLLLSDKNGNIKKAEEMSETDFRFLLEQVQYGVFDDDTYIPMRISTPKFFRDVVHEHSDGKITVMDVPLAAQVKHVAQNMEEEDYASYGNARPHELSIDDVVSISKEMGHPAYIVLQKNGRYAMIVSFYSDKSRKKVIASIDFARDNNPTNNYKYRQYMNGYNEGYYNIIVTQYQPDNFDNYLDECEIIYDKKKMNGKYQVGSGRVVTFTHDSPFIDNSISHNSGFVKEDFFDDSDDPDTRFAIKNVGEDKVVYIDNDITLNKPENMKYTEYIEKYIAEMFDDNDYVSSLPDNGIPVFASDDLPGEFANSKYTKYLRNRKQDRFRAKMRLASSLEELVRIATGRRWEKAKHPNNKDVKYGVYKYSSSFAFPALDASGKTEKVFAYNCDIVVINASNGKKYLYDVQNIKENTELSEALTEREQKKDSFQKKETLKKRDTTTAGGISKKESAGRQVSQLRSISKESISHKSEFVKEDFSLKENNDTAKTDTRELLNTIADLKHEFEITKFAKADPKKLSEMVRSILKDYSSKADSEAVMSAVDELYTYMANGVDGNPPVWNEVYSRALDIASGIVENAVKVDDTAYREYADLRNYLRNVPMKFDVRYDGVPSGYSNFNEFRKKNFGRMRFSNDGVSVDSVYQELAQMYPQFFDAENEITTADQLERIVDVLDEIRPIESNPYAAEMKDATRYLANDILDRFFDIPQAKPTFADKAERRVVEAKIEGQRKLDRERERRDLNLQKQKEKYRAIIGDVRKSKYDALEREKTRYRQRIAGMTESRKASELRSMIYRHSAAFAKKLVKGTDKSHIPYELQGAVLSFVELINGESKFEYVKKENDHYYRVKAGTVEGAKPARKVQVLKELQEKCRELEQYTTVDPDLIRDGGLLSEVSVLSEKRIEDLNLTELEAVWNVIRTLEASIANSNNLFSASKIKEISEITDKLRSDNIVKKMPRQLKGILGGAQQLARIDMMTPETYLHCLGDAGDEMFRMLHNAQDENSRIWKVVDEFADENLKGEKINRLEKELKTVKLGGKNITLTTAQLMELYVLNKREQAKEHIRVGGILPGAINGKGIFVINHAEPLSGITDWELANAFTMLTDKQRALADKMQEFVSTVLGKYGNEASMQVYNYEKFHEKNYWPIRTNKQEIASGVGDLQKVASVAGKGMAKNTVEKAKNSVCLGSIFETFISHCADMAAYSAWLGTTEDMKRIKNYIFCDDKGNTTGTVKGILDRVHGPQGTAYFEKLLTDIAIGVKGVDNMNPFWKQVGSHKAAAVGANLRVIIQQPTAILRALDMIGVQYLAAGISKVHLAKRGWNRAKKYAPIAQLKSWGTFDIGNGRQMKDIILGTGKVSDKITNFFMLGASAADAVTWGALWNAVEAETKVKHKGLDVGSEAYYRVVAERFTEIVDHTQVVDGILQRSQIMRSGSDAVKMATSFMGESIKQYNMAMQAVYDVYHSKGNRAKAVKKLGTTAIGLILGALANAAMQSFSDAERDDDKEKKYWEKWWSAFKGDWEDDKWFEKGGNLVDAVNPLNYLPFVKDIVSIVRGYEVKRMDTETIAKTYFAIESMIKAITGTGKNTVAEASLNLTAEVARLFGIPLSNLKREIKSLFTTFALETDNYLMQYHMEKAVLDINFAGNRSSFIDILYNAYNNDREAYEIIYNDLIENGITDEDIKDGMETRMKKAAGTTEVSDLDKRYMSPEDERRYDNKLKQINESDVWKKANEDQRKDAKADLYYFIASAGEKAKKTRKEAAEYGVDETEYVLWQLAKSIADNSNDNNDSMNEKEKSDAIGMLPGLGDSEIAYFYNTEEADKAYENRMDMRNYAEFKGATADIKGKGKESAIADTILQMDVDDDTAWDLYLTKYDNKGTDYARDNGIEGNTYLKFIASLDLVDKPTKGGKYGSYTQDEVKDALRLDMFDDLSREEKAVLWQSMDTTWAEKNNPYR